MLRRRSSRRAGWVALLISLALLAAILAYYFGTTPYAPRPLEMLRQSSLGVLVENVRSPDTPVPTYVGSKVSPTSGQDAVSRGLPEVGFSGRYAYRHTVALGEEIGSRPAGTLASVRAGDYIESQLREYGYDTMDQRFPIRYYQDLGSHLHVISPNPRSVNARAAVYSAPGRVTAPLVAVGPGTQKDLITVDVTGKVAVLRVGDVAVSDMVDAVTNAGALGVVLWSEKPGTNRQLLSKPSRIPVVSVSSDDGQSLLQLTSAGTVEVELMVDCLLEQRLARNILAVAKNGAGPKVIVTAHFDSSPYGKGVNGNATGVAIMLEMARILADEPVSTDVGFVAFGAAELGHIGSQHYLDSLAQTDRARIALVIDLEALAVGGSLLIGPGNAEADWAATLADDVAALAGISTNRFSPRNVGDHLPLSDAGIPTLVIHRPTELTYRPELDTLDQIERPKLEEAGRFTELLIKQVLLRLQEQAGNRPVTAML